MQHHPWFSSAPQVSARRKAKLLVRKVKFPTPANIKVFQDYNRLFNSAKAKHSYFFTQFREKVRDAKQTWYLIRDLIGVRFFTENGLIISSSLEIAAGFNEFYMSVGSKLAADILASARTADSYLGDPINVDFQFSEVSMEMILNVSKLL
jgi:hypothetical protein